MAAVTAARLQADLSTFVAISAAMQHVRERLVRATATDDPVLLIGEAGTGRERIAREIHSRSARGAGRFVRFECAVLGEKDAEAELFGVADEPRRPGRHGAIHASAGGTLFVPDVTALAVPLQLRLLLAAEEKRARRVGALADEPADVRIVLATQPKRAGRRADDVVRTNDGAGRLRHDLYRQRNALVIDVPPLCERRADILPLARAFAERERPGMTFAAPVEDALESHGWAGNIEELERAVVQAIRATIGSEISIDALPIALGGQLGAGTLSPDIAALTYREMLEASRERVSRAYFATVLKEAGGNVTQAAARAGIERESLHRLLKRFGLNADAFRPK